MPIIAIIGIDGCGKTTQARMLVEQLVNEGYKAMHVQPVFAILNILPPSVQSKLESILSPRKIRTTQPNSPMKRIIRGIRSFLGGILAYPYALLSYMLLAFYSRKNRMVICDRYFYQFFFDLYGNRSQKIIKVFPKPNVAYFLQGDLSLLYSRMSNPSDLAVSKVYYTEVNDLYKNIARKHRFIEIDASLTKEMASETILNHFKNFLKNEGDLIEANYA